VKNSYCAVYDDRHLGHVISHVRQLQWKSSQEKLSQKRKHNIQSISETTKPINVKF